MYFLIFNKYQLIVKKNMNNLTEFKNDFNNLLRCEDIMEKYKISKTTYHTIVRRLGLKRPKKLFKIFVLLCVFVEPPTP